MLTATTPKGLTARHALIVAAERLFAERGIDGVSLAEITTAAGLSNSGAVHYYFDGREGLLDAVVDHHRQALQNRRVQLLRSMRAGGGRPPAGVIRLLIEPLVELLDSERGRLFLLVQAQRMTRPLALPDRSRPVVHELAELWPGADEMEIAEVTVVEIALVATFGALARRVRHEISHGRSGREDFARHLADAVTRIVRPVLTERGR
jgi:AcrR family transcriptional regulator